MAGCCDPRGCDRMFGARFAKRMAGGYRRRGLDTTAQAVVDLVTQGGVLGAAADHARNQLVFSHPPRNAVSRAVVATQNLMLRAGRRDFRTFAHSPDAMLAVLAEHGLRPRAAHRGRVWQVAAVSR